MTEVLYWIYMTKTRIVAVSGGVDSVVLLDILSKGSDRLIVAHVDHGIREESGDDARFVKELTKQYGLPCLSTSLSLGAKASEEKARQARYDFLFEQAKKFKATIVTAHHQDDLLGSMAINIARGTGWRGMAVMNRTGIERPLLGLTKRQLYEYALAHRLEWVEDATNTEDRYMRNRMRAGVASLDSKIRNRLTDIRIDQIRLKQDIEREIERVLLASRGNRYFYTNIGSSVALELLRREVHEKTGETPMQPSCERALLAIKTARRGTKHDVSGAVFLSFTTDSFVVHTR